MVVGSNSNDTLEQRSYDQAAGRLQLGDKTFCLLQAGIPAESFKPVGRVYKMLQSAGKVGPLA
jgi:hypothetical protein